MGLLSSLIRFNFRGLAHFSGRSMQEYLNYLICKENEFRYGGCYSAAMRSFSIPRVSFDSLVGFSTFSAGFPPAGGFFFGENFLTTFLASLSFSTTCSFLTILIHFVHRLRRLVMLPSFTLKA